EEAFKLTRDKLYPDKVFETEGGVFVIRWEDEEDIDQEKYLEEKERYADSITYTKQQTIFTSWLERLKQNAEIDRSPFEKLK
ncbi:MAG: hypothetical protein JW882_20375, partial [Deltaproteobacteria bacterium]|nr:hypothetical protein [Deltaproteobacteria bacterium]